MPTTAFVVCHAQRLGMGAVDLDEVLARSPWPLPNVWLGTSVCTQEDADRNVPLLLQTPAAVRFLSVEPLLEAVQLPRSGIANLCACGIPDSPCDEYFDMRCPTYNRIHWVIVGGESGPHARPCRVEWIRSI